MIGITGIANAGVISDVAKISVTDSSAISHSISSGKNGVAFKNLGSGICYFGGSTVDPNNQRGMELLPKEVWHFDRAKKDFQVYFKCATGVSTTVCVIEYA